MSDAPDSKFVYCICSLTHGEGKDHEWVSLKQKMRNSKDGMVADDYDEWGDGEERLAQEMADEWDQHDVDGYAGMLHHSEPSETLVIKNTETGKVSMFSITLEPSFIGHIREIKEDKDNGA